MDDTARRRTSIAQSSGPPVDGDGVGAFLVRLAVPRRPPLGEREAGVGGVLVVGGTAALRLLGPPGTTILRHRPDCTAMTDTPPGSPPPPAVPESVPLVPRQVLFGNPERMSPRISPDGTRLAWIAPDEGVL